MTRRRTAAVLLSTLAILPRSGCGEHGPAQSRPRQHRTEHARPVGAVADLSKVRCKPGPTGDWEGTGTLTNSTRKPRSYDVTFAVIKPKTSEVEGKAEKSVTVGARATQRIRRTSIHQGDVKSGRCVFTVALK